MRATAKGVALLVTALVLGAGVGCAPSKPKTHSVLIKNFAFAPASVAAAVGDTMVFMNEDFVPHSATGDAGQFDSGAIERGGTWRYVVDRKGRKAYHCTMHPSMTAVLDVK